MEVHVGETSFGNHVRCSSYPNLTLFRSYVQNVAPGRRTSAGIHRCVMKNDFDGLKRILSSRKREAINDCDHFGRTALHIALQTANPKALYLLLYYPLIHPSKMFATLDWDNLLAEPMEPLSEGCEVSVQVESDSKDDELEISNKVEIKVDKDKILAKSKPNDTSTRTKEVKSGSTKKSGKGTKRRFSEASKGSRTVKRSGTSHIGTCLLKHWEETPSCYTRSFLSLEHGQNIFGCGVKEVEMVYEEHYKFLIGESNALEKAARNYSAKYPMLYANHPANLEHIKRMIGGDPQKVHTRISVETSPMNKRQSTSITTYLSDHPIEEEAEVPDVCSNNEEELGKFDLGTVDRGNGSPKNAHENLNAVSTIHGEEPLQNDPPVGNGFRRSQLLNSCIGILRDLPVPLITSDIIATYDKTAPIHLLFSNIYIESSRENICKCFRILLHYFNKFSDCVGRVNLQNDTLYRYSKVIDDFKTSLKVPHPYTQPRVSGTATMTSTESSPQVKEVVSKVRKRFSLISLGIPSSSRTSVHSERPAESSWITPERGEAESLTPPVRLTSPKNTTKPVEIVGGTEFKGFREFESTWGDVEVDSGRRSFFDDRDSLSVLWTTSPKSADGSDGLNCTADAVNTLYAIDIEDVKPDPINEEATKPPATDQNLRSSVLQESDDGNTSNDHRRSIPGMNQTLCADVCNMDGDELSRSFSTIGDFRHCKQGRIHKTCFQIPVKHTRNSGISKYFLIERQDPKMCLLNDAILSSSSWLKPTQAWETFLNKRDYTRSNILHKICQIKDVDMLKWLIGCGCMPLVVNEVGDMPVHLAMDTNDPMCLLTILHATLEGLFYHNLSMVGIQDDVDCEEMHSPRHHNTNGSGGDSPFSKYMNALKYVNSPIHDSSSTNDTSSASRFSGERSPCETSDYAVADEEGSGGCVFQNCNMLEDTDGILRDRRHISFFDEMLMLMEQLTYRGIKAGSWEGLVTIFSYNEAISYHLLSNPHFMHRFINISVMLGNSENFIATVNYVVTSVFKWSDKPDHVTKAKDINGDVGVKPNIAKDVPVKSVDEGKSIHSINGEQSAREPAPGMIHSFKGCGFPSDTLKLTLEPASKNIKRFEPADNSATERENQRRLESLLKKFREYVPKETPNTDNKLTWVITHPTCLHHLALPEPTDAPQRRHKLIMTYPENPTRLEVIISNENGILRSNTLENVKLLHSPPPATLADILRVHDWGYINKLLSHVQLAQKRWQTNAYWPVLADGDTPTTPHSWNSALYAAGAVIAAVDAVCNNNCRNAFCAVRPPGHHLGTWGGAQSENFEDEDFAAGSQGFCLINNVAVGAAYAKYIYGNKGIRKIAIVDFDIHHGNGTDQIVHNIGPRTVKCRFGGGFNNSNIDPNMPQSGHHLWFGWRDATDREDVFFSSIHAYDGVFYPGTGKPCIKYDSTEPRIINVAVPEGTTSPEFRVLFETKILPYLLHFKPDLIFISAGFDGHYRDSVSSGFTKYTEKDFYWATERLVCVANTVCNGRVVSVLEGGYNTRLDTLSPFAKSVFEHVKALSCTNEKSFYPLMHCENTIDFLISPVVGHRPTLTPDATNLRYMETLLYNALNKAKRTREAIRQLLRQVYSIRTGSVCTIPSSSRIMPMYLANLEALAQTDNSFYSFYSKNFDSFFIDGNSLGSIQPPTTALNDVSSCYHDLVTFEKLLGIECTSTICTGSLMSYTGNSLTQSKLVSIHTMWSGDMTDKRVINRLLYSNPWSIDIKIRSLERNATAAALLLEYFKKNEALFTRKCELH